MGDKQRADCVAAKPGPPAVRGAWGTTGRRREEGEGGRRLSNAINLHSLSVARAGSTGGRTSGTRKGEDTFSRRRHSEKVKMSLVVGLKNMIDEANDGDDY